MSKTKTGIVMEVKNNKVSVMTPGGEFIDVKVRGRKPEVGEEYTGESVMNMPSFRNIAVAASLVLFLLTGTAAYAYSIPVATVTLSNPSVKVEVNRWNRIIKTTPLDNEAKDLLSSVNINNKSLNDGLNIFVDEIKNKEIAKNNNGKNSNSEKKDDNSNNGVDDSKKIVVFVDNQKDNSEVNLSKFEEHASKSNVNVEITKSNNKNSNPPGKNKNDKGNNGKKTDNNKNNNGKSNGNSDDKSSIKGNKK